MYEKESNPFCLSGPISNRSVKKRRYRGNKHPNEPGILEPEKRAIPPMGLKLKPWTNLNKLAIAEINTAVLSNLIFKETFFANSFMINSFKFTVLTTVKLHKIFNKHRFF